MKGDKRGHLAKMDLLPPEGKRHVIEAIEQLKAKDRTQDEIREELNNHLLTLGLEPISKSAFNRKALYIAAVGQDLLHAREVAAVMAEKLDNQPEGDVGLLLNETIKALVYDVVMDAAIKDESASIAMLKAASNSLVHLERARKISIETKTKIMKEFAGKADQAIVEAGKKAGLSVAAVKEIRHKVLGVVKK